MLDFAALELFLSEQDAPPALDAEAHNLCVMEIEPCCYFVRVNGFIKYRERYGMPHRKFNHWDDTDGLCLFEEFAE